MATVLSPIVQSSGPITMPYSSDAYQNPPTQPKTQQQRSSQMPRTQAYNGTAGGTGYRGTSAPIAPYAFSNTPQLRQENRSVSAPNTLLPSVTQARLGHPSHPSSSSDSTVSTSGSSNRSLAGAPLSAKDDSDPRKPADNFASSISLSIPDLSLSIGDAPVKPSPGRYRRGAGRTDSSTSIPTGASTPTQRSASAGLPASGSSQPIQNGASSSPDTITSVRPGHNRASSADDTQVPRSGGIDPAKRYRRRSLSGLEAGNLTTDMASLQVAPQATQSTASNNVRPASSAGRAGSRPTSSSGHERQGSAGSGSSNTSSKIQVCALAMVDHQLLTLVTVTTRTNHTA